MSEDKKNELKIVMDSFVHNVYKVSKLFPKDELYGGTSQLRRSSLSVILNFVEGFARDSYKSQKQFYKISYGSLKEAEYLLEFSNKEGYLSENNYNILAKQADRIGGMLWGRIHKN